MRGNGWNVFGTLVLVFLILIAASIVIGLLLVAVPIGWRYGLSDVIAGTLVAPFIAVVVTLMYYRLPAPAARSARHCGSAVHGRLWRGLTRGNGPDGQCGSLELHKGELPGD